MDPATKLSHTIDALFGTGVSGRLPKDVDITFSKRTGRIRTVSHGGRLLCTLRIDGGLAITIHFAQMLLKARGFRENCVEVTKEAAPFIREGRSVFCKHVAWCGRNVLAASDTPILFQGEVIAVGRAVLPGPMITDFGRGVAVKVRDSLKGRGEEGEA